MTLLIDLAVKELDKRIFEESPKYVKEATGLSFHIWTSKNIEKHGPRIKVSNKKAPNNFNTEDESFTLTTDDDPQIIGDTKEAPKSRIRSAIAWVKQNKSALIDYTKHRDDALFLRSLKNTSGEYVHHSPVSKSENGMYLPVK